MILRSLVLSQYWYVDGQTDGQTDTLPIAKLCCSIADGDRNGFAALVRARPYRLPLTGRFHPIFPGRCRILTYACVPNLVRMTDRIGCGLPESFPKDLFFRPLW